MTNKKPNDFDIDQIIEATSEHQKSLDDIKSRVKKLEDIVSSPDQLGEKLSNSIDKSTVVRKSLYSLLIELMNDHDSRKKLQSLLATIDRENFFRWGKYVLTGIAWVATVAGGIYILK